MQSGEQRIFEEVKRRKQRAWQSGAIKSAFDLYRERLPYYDAWSANCAHRMHSQIVVTNKTQTKDGDESIQRIEATIRGNLYVFAFHESSMCMDDGMIITGYLDVEYQGQRVMRIDCRCEDDRYAGRSWIPTDVSAFIEGPWIAELNSVFAEITRSIKKQNERAKKQSKQQELDNLKKNFGLKVEGISTVAREKGFLGAVRSIIHRLLRT
jgi:hypothetical protein